MTGIDVRIMGIKKRIIKILEEIFGNDMSRETFQRINLITNAGMDSLSFIALVVSIEDEFDIEIEFEDIEITNFQTLDSICEIIKKYYTNGM